MTAFLRTARLKNYSRADNVDGVIPYNRSNVFDVGNGGAVGGNNNVLADNDNCGGVVVGQHAEAIKRTCARCGNLGTDVLGNGGALGSGSPVRLHAVGSGHTVGKPKVKRRYTWTCQYCGIDFETENLQQRYCKPSHKQRAYELRQEQRAEQSVDVTP